MKLPGNKNPAAEPIAVELPPPNSERILVIEDDRGVQKALKRLFEGEGFTVDVASNGAAGLEMFHASKPAVVMLDLRLPGMPGQDVCREVSQAAPSVPIIILSAKTEVMDKVLLLERRDLPRPRPLRSPMFKSTSRRWKCIAIRNWSN